LDILVSISNYYRRLIELKFSKYEKASAVLLMKKEYKLGSIYCQNNESYLRVSTIYLTSKCEN
jgi:hypothetical protein